MFLFLHCSLSDDLTFGSARIHEVCCTFGHGKEVSLKILLLVYSFLNWAISVIQFAVGLH